MLAQQRSVFRELHALYDQLSEFNLDTLSMGMSNDFEMAVAEGATLVGVGTDLFGSREAGLTE